MLAPTDTSRAVACIAARKRGEKPRTISRRTGRPRAWRRTRSWKGVRDGLYYKTPSGGGNLIRAATLPEAPDAAALHRGRDNRHPDDKEDRPAIPDYLQRRFESTSRPFLGACRCRFRVSGSGGLGRSRARDSSLDTLGHEPGWSPRSAPSPHFMSCPSRRGSGLWLGESTSTALARCAGRPRPMPSTPTVDGVGQEFIGVNRHAVPGCPEALRRCLRLATSERLTNVTAFFDWLKQRHRIPPRQYRRSCARDQTRPKTANLLKALQRRVNVLFPARQAGPRLAESC